MKSVFHELERLAVDAVRSAHGVDLTGEPVIAPSKEPKFGDYQINCAMGLAKQLKAKPRDIASAIVEHLDVREWCEPPEIAGPGFINLRLRPDALARHMSRIAVDDRLGIGMLDADQRQTVVLDFAGPNLAKRMHVGHLRSMIIGDVLGRVLEFMGHDLIRQSHVGDFGLQFGMLMVAWEQARAKHPDDNDAFWQDFRRDILGHMEQWYKQVNAVSQNDPAVLDRARWFTTQLQGGDAEAQALWEQLRQAGRSALQAIYDRLHVLLTIDEERGESFYRDRLPGMVAELVDKGLAREDDGAMCVFLDEFKGKDGSPLPVIIQKSDGGYLYATTDLAALRYRTQEGVQYKGEHKPPADRVIYLTDARQQLHFRQVFAVAHEAGWDTKPDSDKIISLEHIVFGSVQGEDGKPLKTRSGDSIKLDDLLDEAVRRARTVVDDKNSDLDEQTRQQIAETVGIAAIRYADLSQNRISDYIFSFDKMLAMEGNTAPYLLYAYTRIRSIARRGDLDLDDLPADVPVLLDEPAEMELAKHIIRLPEVLELLTVELKPNLLTTYLYELASRFSRFYESCPVLKAEHDALRNSRLVLCAITARTLRCGLGLLGIEPPEQM